MFLQLKDEHASFYSDYDGSEIYMQHEHYFRSENNSVVALYAHILF